MKNEKEEPRLCGNAGCGRPAEKGSLLCDSCNLEWSLFHREARAEADASLRFPQPPSDNTLTAT